MNLVEQNDLDTQDAADDDDPLSSLRIDRPSLQRNFRSQVVPDATIARVITKQKPGSQARIELVGSGGNHNLEASSDSS